MRCVRGFLYPPWAFLSTRKANERERERKVLMWWFFFFSLRGTSQTQCRWSMALIERIEANFRFLRLSFSLYVRLFDLLESHSLDRPLLICRFLCNQSTTELPLGLWHFSPTRSRWRTRWHISTQIELETREVQQRTRVWTVLINKHKLLLLDHWLCLSIPRDRNLDQMREILFLVYWW